MQESRGAFVPRHTYEQIDNLPQHTLINLGVLWWFMKLPDTAVVDWSEPLPKALDIIAYFFPSRTLSLGGMYELGRWMLRHTDWRVDGTGNDAALASHVIKLGKRPWNDKVIMKPGARYVFKSTMPKVAIDNTHRIPLVYDETYYGTQIQWCGNKLLRSRMRVGLPSELRNLTGWQLSRSGTFENSVITFVPHGWVVKIKELA